MFSTAKLIALCCALLVYGGVTLSVRASDRDIRNDAWITRDAVTTKTGQVIPAGAYGIAYIDRPREVTLLHLRGRAGQGRIILRGAHPGDCLEFATRFVAGDFGGDDVSGGLARPVRIVLKSRRVAKALAQGDAVVSDMYRVSATDDDAADILLGSGLDEGFGFVVNPGRNLTANIFGPWKTTIPCAVQPEPASAG